VILTEGPRSTSLDASQPLDALLLDESRPPPLHFATPAPFVDVLLFPREFLGRPGLELALAEAAIA
jgi:hypothetical protein